MTDPAGPPRRKVGNAYPTARKSSTPLMIGAGAVIVVLAVSLFLLDSRSEKKNEEVPSMSPADSIAAAENMRRADSAAKAMEDSAANANKKK